MTRAEAEAILGGAGPRFRATKGEPQLYEREASISALLADAGAGAAEPAALAGWTGRC